MMLKRDSQVQSLPLRVVGRPDLSTRRQPGLQSWSTIERERVLKGPINGMLPSAFSIKYCSVTSTEDPAPQSNTTKDGCNHRNALDTRKQWVKKTKLIENVSKCKSITYETRSEKQARPQESTLNGVFVTEDKRTFRLILVLHMSSSTNNQDQCSSS